MQRNIFMTIAILLILLVNNNLKADHKTCYPDCIDDKFQIAPGSPLTVTLSPTCVFIVGYEIRIACGMYHDIQIDFIDVQNNGCVGMSTRQLLDAAVANIISNNAMGWPLPVNQYDCVTNWRLTWGTCWYRAPDTQIPTTEHVHWCNDDGPCCQTYYRICRDINGWLTLTIEDEQAPPIQCGVRPEGYPCVKVCD